MKSSFYGYATQHYRRETPRESVRMAFLRILWGVLQILYVNSILTHSTGEVSGKTDVFGYKFVFSG